MIEGDIEGREILTEGISRRGYWPRDILKEILAEGVLIEGYIERGR